MPGPWRQIKVSVLVLPLGVVGMILAGLLVACLLFQLSLVVFGDFMACNTATCGP